MFSPHASYESRRNGFELVLEHPSLPAFVEQMEIVLNFFTGYYDQGLYCDDLRLIGL
jgi:hypothetical protein